MTTAIEKKQVNGMLLERHVTGAHQKGFVLKTLEIAGNVDYGYYFGMRLHQIPSNSCTAVNKCVQELVDGETFQTIMLNVSAYLSHPCSFAVILTQFTYLFIYFTVD